MSGWNACASCGSARIDCNDADQCCEPCRSTAGCTHQGVSQLRAERDEARAQAVAATTDADDLRAVARDVIVDYGDQCCDNPAACACSMARMARLLVAGRAPDLLGPQIGAQSLADRVEAVVSTWPPGPRKGDVYRALGEDR